MRNFLSIMLLGFVMIQSCNYEKYKSRVASGKGTYWDVYKTNDSVSHDPLYSYFCAVNGECYYYLFKRSDDGTPKRYIVPDNASPATWTMKKDTIQLRGTDYLVWSHNDKKLILIPVNRSADTLELVESTIQ